MNSKYLILIKFTFLVLLIGACSSPNYINKYKMNNLKLSSDIQYFIDEKFKPNSINSICVGKIINKAKKQKYSFDKIELTRRVLYAHLSPKKYQDIELHKLDYGKEENSFFKSNINLNSCDAVINGEILKFENNFFLAYSNAKISLNLYLLNKNDKILWKAYHTGSSQAGSLPISPIGLVSGIYQAANNFNEEIVIQLLDTVARRMLKTLPDRKILSSEMQNKYVQLPNPEIKQIKSSQNLDNFYKLFNEGNYEDLIKKLNIQLKNKSENDQLIFLRGRSYLKLNQLELAKVDFAKAYSKNQKEIYLNGVAYILTKQKRFDEALEVYNDVIIKNNKNSFAYYNAGLILEMQNKTFEAGKYFYSASLSAILNNDLNRIFNSYYALERVSKVSQTNKNKLKLIKEKIRKLSINE